MPRSCAQCTVRRPSSHSAAPGGGSKTVRNARMMGKLAPLRRNFAVSLIQHFKGDNNSLRNFYSSRATLFRFGDSISFFGSAFQEHCAILLPATV
jgi:hypothetical protein